jgi:hypothetical protein
MILIYVAHYSEKVAGAEDGGSRLIKKTLFFKEK